MARHATALTIAGSDSGGGTGIQADLKTFSALGVYGTSPVIAPNRRGVFAVECASLTVVVAQIAAVLDDTPPKAIKIGMLAWSDIVVAVADAIKGYGGPVVLDPVMSAKSGDALLAQEAEAARRLSGDAAPDPDETEAQGRALLGRGARAVAVAGPTCIDRPVAAWGVTALGQPRIATRHTHGAGCSLSSATAAKLAKGADVEDAIRRAQGWLHGAVRAVDGLGIGGGHRPVHQFHETWR